MRKLWKLNMAKKNDTLKKIDKELGVPLKGEEFYLLKQHSKLVIAKASQIHDLLVDMAKSESSNQLEVTKILKWLENFKITIPSEFNIANFPEQKEFPSELKIIEPEWLKKIYLPITEAIKAIDIPPPPELIDILDRYTDPKNPLAVRLSDGKKFIEKLTALYQAVQAGTVDQETKDLLQGIIDAVNSIDINIDTLEIGLDDLEFLSGLNLVQRFNEVTVASATESVIASYTPSGKKLRIKGITASGQADGVFRFYNDGVRVWQWQNSQQVRGQSHNTEIEIANGKVSELRVLNEQGASKIYTGSFYGYLLAI